jgi:hypothetical protein
MIIEPEPKSTIGGLIGRIFFDPWIAMLAAGAIGTRMHIPFLVHIGYWDFVLLVIAIQALSPIHHTRYRVKSPNLVNVLLNDHRRNQNGAGK